MSSRPRHDSHFSRSQPCLAQLIYDDFFDRLLSTYWTEGLMGLSVR